SAHQVNRKTTSPPPIPSTTLSHGTPKRCSGAVAIAVSITGAKSSILNTEVPPVVTGIRPSPQESAKVNREQGCDKRRIRSHHRRQAWRIERLWHVCS